MYHPCKQENTSLKKLDLSENDFGKHDGVAATLSTMLRHNKTLTHLNICNCNLNSIQFAQILEALQCNKSLVSLKLGNSSDTESTLIDALAGDEHDNLDPGTGRLLHNLHNLIAWNNATVTFLQVSTRDFCLDSEEDCPGLTVKIVVYNYRNMFVLARALQMIKFGLELNRAGRRNIVPDGNQPNRR